MILSLSETVIHASGNAGVSGADFLEIGVGSRPLALGEAFTAALNDINSIYYNPAGLGTMKFPVFSVMHQELILDSRFENASVAFPLPYGFMGVSASVFWVPPFEKIDVEGNQTGTVQFYNSATTVAYGFSLGFVELGISGKYIYQRIDTLVLHSAAVDLGILKRLYLYSPFDAPVRNFAVGFSIQNIGTKAKDDPLPRIARLGLNYNLTRWLGVYTDFVENIIDSSDLYDFAYGFDENFRINTGLELSYMDIVYLRGGYRFNDAGTYSFGFGFDYAIKNVSFVIDMSYSDTGIFGPNYSITVAFKLIPKVITIEDKFRAEKHYQKGIKNYVDNRLDDAIGEFEKCRQLNEYHKNVKDKIDDLKKLKEMQKDNEKLEEELQESW